ncbi:DUF3307 domain-containing protein [Aquimarina gracilis]|uniref:DUF3307 domain-containing protein n=1 Tax=Aquimarina gracilis TaxID=874422 RepID=UPI0038992068
MMFIWILVAHWIGDYVFQTSKMAMGKSRHLKWLAIHVGTYTLVISICCLFLFPIKIAISYFLINGILHGITDFFTSRLSAKYQKTPRIFFPILGFDQLIHMITLYLTFIHKNALVFF